MKSATDVKKILALLAASKKIGNGKPYKNALKGNQFLHLLESVLIFSFLRQPTPAELILPFISLNLSSLCVAGKEAQHTVYQLTGGRGDISVSFFKADFRAIL
jgi:hypothetical protein